MKSLKTPRKVRIVSIALLAAAAMTAVPSGLASPGYVKSLGVPYARMVELDIEENRVYVSGDRGIDIFDAATNELIDNIDVTTWAPADMALNPVTDKMYLLRSWDLLVDQVYVLDLRTRAFTNVIELGGTMGSIEVNPVTDRIYIANYANHTDGTVSVIDGATDQLISTFDPDPVGLNRPGGIRIDPTRKRIYLSDNGEDPYDGVYAIDAETHQVLWHILGGYGTGTARSLAVNTITNRVYVGDGVSDRFWVVDGDSGQILSELRLKSQSDGGVDAITVNEENGRVYIAQVGWNVPGTLVVLDGSTNRVVDKALRIGNFFSDLAINPARHWIYLVGDDADVFVITEDGSPPVSRFITQNGKIASDPPTVTGTTTDAFAGVTEVKVTYTSATGSGLAQVTTICDQARLSCSWTAALPSTPGTYLVKVSASDTYGNVETPKGPLLVTVLPSVP